MSIQRRIDQVIRHLQRPDTRAEALALANETIETLVAMDLLHVEDGHELPSDSRLLLDHVVTLWRTHANDLDVPNDGSAERRVLALCRVVGDRDGQVGDDATFIDGELHLAIAKVHEYGARLRPLHERFMGIEGGRRVPGDLDLGPDR